MNCSLPGTPCRWNVKQFSPLIHALRFGQNTRQINHAMREYKTAPVLRIRWGICPANKRESAQEQRGRALSLTCVKIMQYGIKEGIGWML